MSVPWEAGEGIMRAREAMERADSFAGQGRMQHRFRCRNCGYAVFAASSRSMNCPKCGSPMIQVF